MTDSECPFCEPVAAEIITRTDMVTVFRDGFPLSQGHTLIVPTRHVGSFFDLNDQEQTAVLSTLRSVKDELVDLYAPDGFNVGFNDGPAAGQTVDHCHVHVIPRYLGDVPDPRGGIRWVVPDKAEYW
jgi:diadenosine tetraphosphate (Ap4A) HIT family hydrolase